MWKLAILTIQMCIVATSLAETIILGDPSSSEDDAKSMAACPEGFVVSHCEVASGLVTTKSDGAFVDPESDGSVCVAVNGAGGSGAVALAQCSRDSQVPDPCGEGQELPKFIHLHSRGPNPRVSCPPGYQQTVCNARSPWLGYIKDKGINSNGVIPNENACAVPDCTDSKWCEVTAVCMIMEDSEGYQNEVCPPSVTVEGNLSGTSDDAISTATCPGGHVVTYCEVKTGKVQTESDGAFVDPESNGSVCVAVNSYKGTGAVALAECSRDSQVPDPCNSNGPELPKFINLHSRGPSPSVSCPPGYQQTVCNARSPWVPFLQNKGVNSNGVIPNENACAVPDCTDSKWCEVTAVCMIMEDSEGYQNEVCPPSVTVEGNLSGTSDDAISTATCPGGHVVTYCEVKTGKVQTESDGAFVDPESDGSVCVAVNSYKGTGAVALAECSKDSQVPDPCNSNGPELPKFINLHSRGPSPSVSCPPGYQQTVCNARSPWVPFLQNKGVNSNGVIPNDSACAVPDCSESNWCEVTAVCRLISNFDTYKNAACSRKM